MKICYLVSGAESLGISEQQDIIIVTMNNYREVFAQYQGCGVTISLFIYDDVPAVFLLKFIEEYCGDIFCYISGEVSSVLFSRFHDVINLKTFNRTAFPVYSEIEQAIIDLKRLIR